jgi:hypothetical protein
MWENPQSDRDLGFIGSLPRPTSHISHPSLRAGNGTRTRDPNLGKVVLYQLSYSRNSIKTISPPAPPAPSTSASPSKSQD